MAVTKADGSVSVSTTEYFLASASTTQTAQTTACELQVIIDPTANVIAGDVFRARVYETINGTQRVIYEYTINGVTPVIVFPPFMVMDGWEASLLKTAGTARVIFWSLRKLVPDTATLGAGAITSTTFATGAITAAAFAANAITSTVLAASAIGSSQLATGAITAATFAANAITSTVIAASAIGASQLAASAIGASQIAAAAFTAAKFASDAIDANALAANAVTEIQAGLAASSAVASVQTDTTALLARLPAALVGGRISADVGSWLGTAAATPTVAGIPKVEDATLRADYTGARALKLDHLDVDTSSRAAASTAVSNVNLTPTRAALLDNLDVLMSTRAAASTALSTAQWTNARAGYLDNANVGGPVASSAEVVAIQNNTRVVRVVPSVVERPDAGTTTYRVELLLYDAVGNMEAPDAAPTIALVNQTGTDLSTRLDSVTMALVSTGRYRAVYTADVGDALEQLVWTFSVVEGGTTRLYGNTSLVVDTSAVDFTAADRTKLTTLASDLTTARAGKLDQLDVAVSTLATSAAVAALPSVAAIQSGLATSAAIAALPSVVAIQAGLATSAAVAALPGVAAIQSGLATSAAVAALPTAASIAALPTTGALAAVQTDTTTLLTRLTAPRATSLDNLDTTLSSRASATAVTALPTTGDIAGLTSDIADLAADIAAIPSSTLGPGAITSTTFATGAITGAALAADAVTKIQTGIATSATLGDGSITAAVLASDAVTKIQAGLATGAAVTAVTADTTSLLGRLPAALDAAGNIKAGVQSLVGGALTAITDAVVAAVFGFVMEAGATLGSRTFAERLRIQWSVFAGKAYGLAITTAGTERFRDAADTKDVATFVLGLDGTRTPGVLDGTP